MVLVIRGELLKSYPNAMIYAHRADGGTRRRRIPTECDKTIDPAKERDLRPLSATEEQPAATAR